MALLERLDPSPKFDLFLLFYWEFQLQFVIHSEQIQHMQEFRATAFLWTAIWLNWCLPKAHVALRQKKKIGGCQSALNMPPPSL